MSIKILADSASDLTKDLYEKYDIDVMPLSVIMNDQEYRDRVNLDSNELMCYMEAGGVPKTSQVPYSIIEETFKDKCSNHETVIYIAFSSGLSGTYNTAKLVERQMKEVNPELDLTVVDSRSATLGLGLIVLSAAKMSRDGHSKNEILEKIEFNIDHIEHFFTVKDLNYLYKGGRIRKSQACFGNILNINPILCVDDGKLAIIDKARGRRRAIKKIIELVESEDYELQNQVIGINHGNDLAGVEYIMDLLKKKTNIGEIIINDVGCAIGAHAGPGFLGVYFINK